MGYTETVPADVAVYQRRKPKASPLWSLIDQHFTEFEEFYDDRYADKYGYLRRVIPEVVDNFHFCGDLMQGFARIRCPDCHHEYLLSFSCRGRWLCPSCHAKKVVQLSVSLTENILFPVPHRQYVFSLPILIRRYFRYDRKLLGDLCHCAVRSLQEFFRVSLNLPDGVPGIVMAIQTFGDYAKWNPHLHAIVADGLFTERGTFHVMPETSLKPLAELFRAMLFRELRERGLLTQEFVTKLMAWRHTSGFSVHNRVRIDAGDRKGLESLTQYVVRNPFSTAKMTYNQESGTVIYRSKMTYGKNRSNFKVFEAVDFIAAITQHIPEKSFQLVRYYGWYSNRMRGDRRKAEQQNTEAEIEVPETAGAVISIADYEPRNIPSPTWRECIKKIWEVDPLICPHCQTEMKIVGFITEYAVVCKILKHLDLWDISPPKSPSTSGVDDEMVYVPCDDGWPVYEEPFCV